ncbi:OmpA family protein [Maribacter chungangensis]|uniref:OmpA family protein n=1 Tax=Maribacter chungangensis TaxID=1069117 RepID=A0ABW3B1Z0_9FLAO
MKSSVNLFFLCTMLLTGGVQNGLAQNLVKNPSFELFINCPQKLGNLDSDVAHWSTPTAGSTDYFNGCSKAMGTPKNFNGEQPAHFGVGYLGFYFYAPDDYREYIQAQLTETLVKGETYTVSFYVSLAERSDFAIREFGVQFVENPVHVDTRKTLSRMHLSRIQGDISNYFDIIYADFYSDKEDWVKVEKEFVANGTENYLLLGNFKNNASTQKFRTKRNVTKGSYYYVDMVAVLPQNPEAHSRLAVIKGEKTFQLDSIHRFKNLLFRFDTFELLADSKKELDEIEAYLTLRNNLKIEINGHTDAIGSARYNKLLSINRAKAVAAYLIAKGLDSSRVSYKGYGSELPVMQNGTPKGRQGNRRVEFRITE